MKHWYERGEPTGSPLAEAGWTRSGRPQPSKPMVCEQGFSLRPRTSVEEGGDP